MYRSEKMQIWKESLKPILFVIVILYIIKAFILADVYHGLIFPEDAYERLPRVINGIRISNIESRGFLTPGIQRVQVINPLINSIITLVLTPILSLLESGLFVQYYKRIAYNEEITVRGVFTLLENNFLRNTLIVVLVNLVVMLGLMLLIVPGLILSLGLYPWALIASEEENDDKTAIEIMRMSWEVSKGNKSFFLLTLIKWAFISFLIQGVLIGLAYFLLIPGLFIGMIILSILAYIVGGFLNAPPDIEIAQRLVHNDQIHTGRESEIEREEEYIEVELETRRDEDNLGI